MFNLIPISLFITAIGGIVYIISNHLSEFSDKEEDNNEENGDNFQFNFKVRIVQWINQLPLDNVKKQSLSLTQKLLHRFRLTLLKTDNYLMKLIGKISEKDKQVNGNSNDSGNNNRNNGNDFWENLSKSKEKSQVIRPIINEKAQVEFAVDKNKKVEKFFDIKPVKKALKTKKSSK